jgi:hypothetical protein
MMEEITGGKTVHINRNFAIIVVTRPDVWHIEGKDFRSHSVKKLRELLDDYQLFMGITSKLFTLV